MFDNFFLKVKTTIKLNLAYFFLYSFMILEFFLHNIKGIMAQ